MTKSIKNIILCLCLVPAIGLAQSNSDTLDQIKKKSAELKEFRDLLNSPDSTIRLGAFDSMSKSDNMALRQMALDEGINSQDAVLRSLAFQKLIMSLKTLSMNVQTEGMNADEKKQVLGTMSELYTMSFQKFEKSGSSLNFRTKDNLGGSAREANINGLKFNWQSLRCAGEATLQTGGLLAGNVRCSNIKNVTIPVSAMIR